MAYPDTNNAFTHTASARLVRKFTSTQVNNDFTFIATADPSRLLGYHVDGADPPSTQWDSTSDLLSGYDNNLNVGASWMNPVSGFRDGRYGGLSTATSGIPFLTLSGAYPDPVYQFTDAGGNTLSTFDNTGALDLGGPMGAFTLKVDFTYSNPNPSSTNVITLQDSPDGKLWTTLATASSAEDNNSTFSLSGTGSSSGRYFRITMTMGIASTLGNPRSIKAAVFQLLLTTPSNERAINWIPVNDLTLAQTSSKAFRLVGMTILVTNESSDLVNGGSIAGVQIGSDFSIADGFPDYNKIAELPNAYNGAFKKGTWGFWSPDDSTDMGFRPWGSTKSLPVLIASGTMSAIGALLRVEVNAQFEYITESQFLGPSPSRSAVWEIAARAEVLSHIACHFCENPMHPRVQAALVKLASMFEASKPYIFAAGKLAQHAGPLLLSML